MSETPNSPELVKEAERVYALYVAEILKLDAAGGATKLPKSFTDLVMEPRLQQAQRAYAELARSGMRAENPTAASFRVTGPAPMGLVPDALVALSTCLDASRVKFADKQGSTLMGVAAKGTTWFKRGTDGQLRVTVVVSEKVEKC